MVVYNGSPKIYQVTYEEFVQWYGPVMFKKFKEFESKCLYEKNEELPYMKIKFYTKHNEYSYPTCQYIDVKEHQVWVKKNERIKQTEQSIIEVKHYKDYRDSPEYKQKMRDKKYHMMESKRKKMEELRKRLEKEILGPNYEVKCDHVPIDVITTEVKVLNKEVMKTESTEVLREVIKVGPETVTLAGIEFDDEFKNESEQNALECLKMHIDLMEKMRVRYENIITSILEDNKLLQLQVQSALQSCTFNLDPTDVACQTEFMVDNLWLGSKPRNYREAQMMMEINHLQELNDKVISRHPKLNEARPKIRTPSAVKSEKEAHHLTVIDEDQKRNRDIKSIDLSRKKPIEFVSTGFLKDYNKAGSIDMEKVNPDCCFDEPDDDEDD